jgi:O-antigen/teichoic acid export membrane protein
LSIKSNPARGLSNKGRLKFLLSDTIIYGLASVLSKSLTLVTFPLLVRYLTIEEYGIIDYFLVLAGLLTTLFIFGQDSAVARFFYEHEKISIRKQLISQSLLFQLLILVLSIPLLWFYSDWLMGFVVGMNDRVHLFKIVLLQLPFLLLINFSQNILKWTFSRTHFLVISIGFTVMQASLLVVAVLVIDVGIAEVLAIGLVASIFFGALGLFFIRKWLVRPEDFSRIREMLPFAIPYGVICVVGSFLPALERTFTNSLLGAESLGLYAAGAKLSMMIGLLVSAFQIAWGPFSLSIYKETDAASTFNWIFKIFTLAVCLATLLLTMSAYPLIRLLATDRFLDAVIVVFPLAMGLAIQAISWMTEIGIGITKRSNLSLLGYGAAIIASLAGIQLFTPIFGLFGVGLGILSGHIAKALVASYLAQKVYPLPWQYAPVLLIISLTMCGGLAFSWVAEKMGILVGNLLLGVTMFLLIGVGWFALFSQQERNRINELLFKLKIQIYHK